MDWYCTSLPPKAGLAGPNKLESGPFIFRVLLIPCSYQRCSGRLGVSFYLTGPFFKLGECGVKASPDQL